MGTAWMIMIYCDICILGYVGVDICPPLNRPVEIIDVNKSTSSLREVDLTR